MLGTKLRTLRESKRLSIAQVAGAIDVCEKTYRKYENNESYPSHDKVEALASFF